MHDRALHAGVRLEGFRHHFSCHCVLPVRITPCRHAPRRTCIRHDFQPQQARNCGTSATPSRGKVSAMDVFTFPSCLTPIHSTLRAPIAGLRPTRPEHPTARHTSNFVARQRWCQGQHAHHGGPHLPNIGRLARTCDPRPIGALGEVRYIPPFPLSHPPQHARADFRCHTRMYY